MTSFVLEQAPAGFKHLAAFAASQSLLSCFPVLCCTLAFPFGTPVHLRLFPCFILCTYCSTNFSTHQLRYVLSLVPV